MTLNDSPEKLKEAEQCVLNNLIERMDFVIDQLDQDMRKFVYEAKQSNVGENHDLYLAHLLAEKGIKDTKENRQKFLRARDELYDTRLLLRCEDNGSSSLEELKVGLHSCQVGSERFVISWTFPVCRHYLLDNSSVHFENIVVDDRLDKKYHTNYTLIAKNKIKLRFTRVVEAVNLYPGSINNDTLKAMKETEFFNKDYLEYLISKFDPNEVNSNTAVEIISDEFLQELLERRSSAEFKNIVFSIQKKQGEIIQAPYSQNMIVQGCAGSGKSMIMLHRLPIILYDNPNSLTRSNLYVITPSKMYIQMAENMRYQLEISDINMGTIEQYYDYCIEKYIGHTAAEYGEEKRNVSLSAEQEQYVYSAACIEDIQRYFESLCVDEEVSLEDKAFLKLGIMPTDVAPDATYARRMKHRIAELQKILGANEDVIYNCSKKLRNVLSSLSSLSTVLKTRRRELERELSKRISSAEEEINQSKKEIKQLDPTTNAKAIQNRNNAINYSQKLILQLSEKKREIHIDFDYFSALHEIASKIEAIIEPFSDFGKETDRAVNEITYTAIQNAGQLVDAYNKLLREFSKIGEKYTEYLSPLYTSFASVGNEITSLETIKERYLNLEYYNQIKEAENTLSDKDAKAITNAYAMVMEKLGNKPNKKGTIKAMKCSPYLYLQILYQYFGAPNKSRESLLSIDEAQGIAPEEIRLLRNINGPKVIFNLFGDERQHIEGSKGINSWSELADIFSYQQYDMQENYRNASQITQYCNKVFDMGMVAINTPGKGVHELQSEEEFYSAVTTQLLDTQRVGLAAIIVSNKAEAKYLLRTFAEYSSKFNDMVSEDTSIHKTRWNIITIADAKGLEFNTVIAISGRMSENERYIAYTRALDDLYVYQNVITLSQVDIDASKIGEEELTHGEGQVDKPAVKHGNRKEEKTSIAQSEVKRFFEERGLEVMDMRAETGRLWVVGEKAAIRDHINQVVAKFGISGKYLSSKEINNRYGWFTKTDK